MTGYSFKTNPSIQDLEDIADWMRIESKTGNLNSILKAWKKEELILINQKDSILGFCAFDINGNFGKINVLEIKENQRGQKLGKILVEYILQKMKAKNVERIEIFVPNSNFKSFWEKLGFKEIFKDYDDSRLDMYINFNI
ncbi:GNAT family N-acetyltransferase [Winogradskyella eckloniae]|uniref:GNAT family N-acetyltransferase n=1 Tax=Winogradskyella eckloniae TaxID=1089306 RepID=UPI00156719CE|nr:GNAT family N-acetyltransferase [Winogradskyella eckloniae]NRD20091.1 GNAT family N-acetyltransferase [Winogradskyella eckloniae]